MSPKTILEDYLLNSKGIDPNLQISYDFRTPQYENRHNSLIRKPNGTSQVRKPNGTSQVATRPQLIALQTI